MNKRVLESIRELLAQTLPPNATARLYGSQARGDAHHGSDWDILIVMDKDKLLPDDYDTVTYPLTKLGWEPRSQADLGHRQVLTSMHVFILSSKRQREMANQSLGHSTN